MAVNLSPVGGVAAQFFDNSGNVLTGGKIYTYLAGTTTPAATYTTSAGAFAWSNPIVLDASGRVSGSGEIWVSDSISYKFILKDSNDVLIATYDNITGINSNFVNFTSQTEIQTATAGQTVFTLTTMEYQPGTNNLLVFVDGVNQYEGGSYSFVETNSTTVTFVSGLHVGAEVKFTTATPINTITADAATTAYTPPFVDSVTTNVEDKLAQTVSVEDFGAVGDGTTDDTTAIQNAIDALAQYQTLLFNANYKITSGLTITNKNNIRLTGKGKITLVGGSSSAYMFQLVGTLDNIEIDHLTLVGDGNDGYAQCAIGCNSGQTISNTSFHDLNISEINVGISHNANLGGSWTYFKCYNNVLKNMLGTVPGSGYGIHTANAKQGEVYGNTIDNASRHSIYLGRGEEANIVCSDNVILNHRMDVADGSPRCAIACSRINSVIISNNTFLNCYDGQLFIDEDSTDANCTNISVLGNKFNYRQNVVPDIWIGVQALPTSYRTRRVLISGNTFEHDMAVSTGGAAINLLNGQDITIENNTLRIIGATSLLPYFINIGNNSYIDSDDDIQNIIVRNNTCTANVSTTGNVFSVCDQLCTGASYYLIKDNFAPSWSNQINFQATPTNLNSKLKFQSSFVYNIGTIPAQTTFTGAFTIIGAKPTSMVSGRPQYSLGASPYPGYAFYAKDDGPNAIVMTATNAKGTTSTQVSQTYLVFVEDI